MRGPSRLASAVPCKCPLPLPLPPALLCACVWSCAVFCAVRPRPVRPLVSFKCGTTCPLIIMAGGMSAVCDTRRGSAALEKKNNLNQWERCVVVDPWLMECTQVCSFSFFLCFLGLRVARMTGLSQKCRLLHRQCRSPGLQRRSECCSRSGPAFSADSRETRVELRCQGLLPHLYSAAARHRAHHRPVSLPLTSTDFVNSELQGVTSHIFLATSAAASPILSQSAGVDCSRSRPMGMACW